MNRSTSIVVLLMLLCASAIAEKPTKPSSPADYAGWYRIADSNTYIPVLSDPDGHLSTVGPRGIEVRLMPTPDGELEWGLESSSLKGTRIGWDDAMDGYYIAIYDSIAAKMIENYESGKRQRLDRLPKPPYLPDATTSAPESINDYLGCYSLLYMPIIRFQISKSDSGYSAKIETYQDDGWTSSGAEKLEAAPDETGFILTMGTKKLPFRYNSTRKRFEMLMPEAGEVSTPLFRLPNCNSAPPYIVDHKFRIGIPTWT